MRAVKANYSIAAFVIETANKARTRYKRQIKTGNKAEKMEETDRNEQ
jgi:hypothetical protein